MIIKPVGELVLVEILDEVAQDPEDIDITTVNGLIAQALPVTANVLAAGPDSGCKAGDVVLCRHWCGEPGAGVDLGNGATFINGKLVERPNEQDQPEDHQQAA